MNRNEKMLENYEDAVFFLLMDQCADEIGERYRIKNNELKNDKSFVVPTEISKSCRKMIHEAFRKRDRKTVRQNATMLLKRIAILVAILVILLTSTFAVSASFRTYALSWIIEAMEDHTNISFVPSTNTIGILETRWLPDGYVCTVSSEVDGMWRFEDGTKHWMIINAMLSDGTELNLDTENAELVKDVQIRDFQGILVKKDGCITLVWYDASSGYLFSLLINDTDEDLVAKIAENLYIK